MLIFGFPGLACFFWVPNFLKLGFSRISSMVALSALPSVPYKSKLVSLPVWTTLLLLFPLNKLSCDDELSISLLNTCLLESLDIASRYCVCHSTAPSLDCILVSSWDPPLIGDLVGPSFFVSFAYFVVIVLAPLARFYSIKFNCSDGDSLFE